MSVKLRARVWKFPDWGTWCAVAYADNATASTRPSTVSGEAPSWPEAMQLAQVLLANLDAELMAEVHASRSSRRTAAPVPATAHASLVTTTEPTA